MYGAGIQYLALADRWSACAIMRPPSRPRVNRTAPLSSLIGRLYTTIMVPMPSAIYYRHGDPHQIFNG